MKILEKIKKIFKSKIFIVAISISIIAMSLSLYAIDMKSFGRVPSGDRLERVKKSQNYKDGQFVNQNPTVMMAFSGSNFFKMMYKFFFEDKKDREPQEKIPVLKTDLNKIPLNENYMVWFGHSSYLIQIDGKRFLIDPVFSSYASPVSFANKAFKSTNQFYALDMPEIDYLVITHDHWDHLDYPTVMALKEKVKNIICPLGVGEHFEYWGFDTTKFIEKDWYESVDLSTNFKLFYYPQRHFSGRSLKRNTSLWASYVIQTPSMKFFIGGDGGYDTHFAEVGKNHNDIDLAFLENGQYNEQWKAIHSLPEQTAQAAIDLKAKRIMPVHSSKFTLAFHSWKEPLEKIYQFSKEKNFNIITPMIGEIVRLNDTNQIFKKWWEEVK